MMKEPARRHESLIPLSREHQYALLLCLRIHRRLPGRTHDIDRLRTRAGKTIRFFEEELTVHFRAEEQVLFPAMSKLSGVGEIIGELLAEHRNLESLVDSLRAVEGGSLAQALAEFADMLEAHIRKEERTLFPIYEQLAPAEVKSAVEQGILLLIGSASQPGHPELLN
jgi:iron-sulfur cluster repair protein YtfE (RIC family)